MSRQVSSLGSGPARTPARKRRRFSSLLLEPGRGAASPPARGGDDPILRFRSLLAEIRREAASAPAPPKRSGPSPAARRKAERIAQDILAWKEQEQWTRKNSTR